MLERNLYFIKIYVLYSKVINEISVFSMLGWVFMVNFFVGIVMWLIISGILSSNY